MCASIGVTGDKGRQSACPIDATRRLASQPRKMQHSIPRRISCATSDTNASLHPAEIELRHEAINHPINQSARTQQQQQLASGGGNKLIRTRAISGIKYDFH
jgi:hypothetical protein